MTLFYKIEKMGIHSVVGEISDREVEGGEKSISKIKKIYIDLSPFKRLPYSKAKYFALIKYIS
jgi:hypothetical protein